MGGIVLPAGFTYLIGLLGDFYTEYVILKKNHLRNVYLDFPSPAGPDLKHALDVVFRNTPLTYNDVFFSVYSRLLLVKQSKTFC